MPKKRPYDQFCPIAQTLDVVGDRWTLLIVRELLVGPARYGELLDALAPISTDVLAGRLKDLEAAGLTARSSGGGYDLTADGMGLLPVLGALAHWGISRLTPASDDQLTTTRALQVLVLANREPASPERTIAIRSGDTSYSLTADDRGYSARRGEPAEPHAIVAADAPTVWALGSATIGWTDAIASGAVTVTGDAAVAEHLLVGRLPMAAR